MKWKCLDEATQTKGDGETHPLLLSTDEFAYFERWDKGNINASVAMKKICLSLNMHVRSINDRS